MHPFEEKIAQARHITLIAGERPDALGSASAFYSYLLTLHKKVSLFCKGSVHPRLAFIPWSEKVRQHVPAGSDLVIHFDGILATDSGHDTLCFDDGCGRPMSQQVYRYLKQVAVRINAKMATALYAGLLDASESFTTPETDSHLFEMAADLMRHGADAHVAVHFLCETIPLNVLRLKGALFSTLELLCDARVAVLRAHREILEAAAAVCSDCDSALAEALHLPTVEIVVLLCEAPDHSIHAVLRSQEKNVAAVAEFFGGAGERFYASFQMNAMSMETAEETIMLHVKDTL